MEKKPSLRFTLFNNTPSLSARVGSGPSETKQWADMIAKPKQAAVVWHRYGTKKVNIFDNDDEDDNDDDGGNS